MEGGLPQALDNMRNKILFGLLIPVMAYIFISCSSQMAEPNDTRLGFTFFPLETGNYTIYEVENTEYKLTGEIVTLNYLLKESVVDSFLNASDSYTYLIHRSTQTNDSDWKLDSVWTARKTSQQVVSVENNIPFIKLIFPFKEKASWDGNRLNTREEEFYTMENVNQSLTLNNQTFDKAVTIVQKDNQDSIIFLERRKEIFAQNVGLIYKESAAIKYCAQPQCIGKHIIDSGVLYKQTILESGKN